MGKMILDLLDFFEKRKLKHCIEFCKNSSSTLKLNVIFWFKNKEYKIPFCISFDCLEQSAIDCWRLIYENIMNELEKICSTNKSKTV